MTCPGSAQRGATLVELVMTIVIISIAIAGVVGAFALMAGRSAEPLNQTRAVALAQLYFEEILSRQYDHNTPEGGLPRVEGCTIAREESSRAGFNDVDDYHQPEFVTPAGPDGGSLGAAYAGFQVRVEVECAGSEVGLPPDEAKRVTLTIVDPSGQDYMFSAYRGNF